MCVTGSPEASRWGWGEAGGVGSKAELQQEVWDMAVGKVG